MQTPPIAPKIQVAPVPPRIEITGGVAARGALGADEAVRIALKNQPSLDSARFAIAAAEACVAMAVATVPIRAAVVSLDFVMVVLRFWDPLGVQRGRT